MPTTNYIDEALSGLEPVKQTSLDVDFTHEEFETGPVCSLAGGGAAGGADTTTCLAAFENNIFEYYNIGTQTLVGPTLAADGLLASLDLTNAKGVEYSQGITARSKSAFVIGTSRAFYLKVGLKIADVSGVALCNIGFRKSAAYDSTFADYTDKATIGCVGVDVKTITALNDDADVTTDTTEAWADGEVHMLEVLVSAAGVVTYKLDGVAPDTVVAFTFDDEDVVIPFLHILHDTTSPGAIHIQSWECGLQ